MVFEQMLTILFGTAAGVAVVLFTVKPRQIVASQYFSNISSIETISLSYQSTSDSQGATAPTPGVTATQSPVEAVNSVSTEVVAAGPRVAANKAVIVSATSTTASDSQASSVARGHRGRGRARHLQELTPGLEHPPGSARQSSD